MTQRVIQPVILTTSARRESHVAAISAAFAAHPRFARPMVHCDEQQDGAAVATRDAISKAAAGGGHVLFLEDDVLVDPEAPALISCAAFPADVAVISFCDMREVPEYAPRGLYRCSALGADGRGWWGNQAILIHAECAAMSSREDWFSGPIQASPGIRTHVAAYGDGGRNCSDIRLSLLVHLHGGDRRLYAVYVPSLFKHVGHDSACFPGRGMGERETRNWIADRRRFSVDP